MRDGKELILINKIYKNMNNIIKYCKTRTY